MMICRFKGFCQVGWVETEGTRRTLVGNATVGIDQIQAIGPACVILLDAIFHGVNQGGHGDVEFPHAGGSHLFALGSGGGVLKNHAFLDVALHLPKIAGMRFVNVNDVERDTLAVLLVELVERGNLPAKRRSSIAAKNQYDRLFATKGRE